MRGQFLIMPNEPKYLDWLNRVWHRPVSIIIEMVREMPVVKELPTITHMTINLKGNRESGEQLIAEIKRQMEREDFFAVEITGRDR